MTALFGAALLSLTACTTSGPAITGDNASAAITGTLNYAEPIPLAPGARAHVALVDGSGEVLAEQVINIRGQVPLSFRIAYDPAVLDQSRSLNLSGEILLADGSTGWRSHQAMAVFAGQPTSNLELVLSAAGAGSGSRGYLLACGELRGYFSVGDGRGTLLLSERSVSLPQVPSADGDLYQSGDVRLWHEGSRASMQVAGKRHAECQLTASRAAL